MKKTGHPLWTLAAALLAAGAACAQAVIDDPVAYWDFEDNASLLSNRVTSSVYHDATVLTGQPASGVVPDADGIVGNALVLDGASAIRLPYHQDNLGTSFTIALWYWQLTNDTRQAVYQSRENYNASYEAIDVHSSSFQSYVGQNTAGVITTGLKEWVHLVHAFATEGNTTTLRVYTNGVLVLTRSATSNAMFNARQIKGFHIGAFREAGRYFKGMLDELALWNRALTDAEAAALYQRGRDGLPLEVTPQPWPRIPLGGQQRAFSIRCDEGFPPGVYQNGWLLGGGGLTPPPLLNLTDTAGRVDDTAGHPDGPFHAEAATYSRIRTPLTAGGLGQLTEGDFTVEARFRARASNRDTLMGNYVSGTSRALTLELQTGTNGVRLFVQPATTGRQAANLLAPGGEVNVRDGQWHHLAGVRLDATLYLYLDGVLVGQTNDTAGAFTLNESHFYLKGDARTTETLFDGDLEDARLWTRGLSSDEVTHLAAGAQPGGAEVPRTGLLAEYAGAYSPHNGSLIVTDANGKYRTPLVPPLSRLTRGDFTVEAWFRSTDAQRGVIMGNYINAQNCCVNLELTADNRVRLYLQNGAAGTRNVYGAGGSSRNGEWHHLAGLRRGSQLYLFLNGGQVGTLADTLGTYDLNGDHFYFGRDFRTGVTVFDGDFRNARLWSRALENGEVSALAAGALPGDPEVALTNLLAEYTSYRPTNSLSTAGFTGDRFLRTFIAGTNTLALAFDGLPRHTAIGLSAFVAQLESLDPVRDNDCFAIRIDGAEVLRVGLGYGTVASGSEPQVASLTLFGQPANPQLLADTLTVGGENLLYGGSEALDYMEHVYDLSRLEALQNIPHTGSTLLIEFVGIHNQDYMTEGFGIDRIELTIPPVKGTLISIQ
jgi:hypothetical protein